jgi:hypothetical protein
MPVRWPKTLVQASKNIDFYWEWQDAKKGIFRNSKRREELLALNERRKRQRR